MKIRGAQIVKNLDTNVNDEIESCFGHLFSL